MLRQVILVKVKLNQGLEISVITGTQRWPSLKLKACAASIHAGSPITLHWLRICSVLCSMIIGCYPSIIKGMHKAIPRLCFSTKPEARQKSQKLFLAFGSPVCNANRLGGRNLHALFSGVAVP